MEHLEKINTSRHQLSINIKTCLDYGIGAMKDMKKLECNNDDDDIRGVQ